MAAQRPHARGPEPARRWRHRALTLPGWLSTWARWRDKRTLAQRAIPDALWQLTLLRFPFLSRRSAADIQRLRELATLFLADKEFAGAHGLRVDDEMAVAIAAQACLPVLRLGLNHDGPSGGTGVELFEALGEHLPKRGERFQFGFAPWGQQHRRK